MINDSLFVHVPMYKVGVEVSCKGKVWAGSKRRMRWTFGYAGQEALSNGATGYVCRGEEHAVDFEWSLTSGKRRVSVDGEIVHESSSHEYGPIYQFSQDFRLPRKNHTISIKAMSLGLVGSTCDQSCICVSFNGLPFCELPTLNEVNNEIFSLYVAVPRNVMSKRNSLPYKSAFRQGTNNKSSSATGEGERAVVAQHDSPVSKEEYDGPSRNVRRRSRSAPSRMIEADAAEAFLRHRTVRFSTSQKPNTKNSEKKSQRVKHNQKDQIEGSDQRYQLGGHLEDLDISRRSLDTDDEDEDDHPFVLLSRSNSFCDSYDDLTMDSSVRSSYKSVKSILSEKYAADKKPAAVVPAISGGDESVVTLDLDLGQEGQGGSQEFKTKEGARVSVKDAMRFVETWKKESAPRYERRRLEITMKGTRPTRITTTSVLTFASNLAETRAPMYERRRMEIANKHVAIQRSGDRRITRDATSLARQA
jgi:hypothetical protein